MNPNRQKIKITKGKIIKLIFLSFMYPKLTLSTKKGQVAPKCVSANNKIVNMINCVSKLGKKYKKKAYIMGNKIGNFINKISFLIKKLNIL